MNKTKNKWFDKEIGFYNENPFGTMALMMTFQSCFGSVAAMTSMKNDNYVLLAICVFITMTSNTFFIAQSPSKISVSSFNISVILCSLILIYNLMFLK